MKQLFFIIMMLALASAVKAQDKCNCPQQSKQGKGTLYFTGGYNFDWFAKSDLHFEDRSSEAIAKGNDYSFTIYNVKVVDKKDEIKDIFHEDITIPQYSFRIGYWFNGKQDLGVELNYDHAKYKMIRNQRVHLKGEIHGQEYDKDVSLDSANFGYYPFLWFEHSNGANFCLVDIVKRANIIHNKNKKLWLGAVFKYGFGFVLPRTDVTIFGVNRNDKYHVAGYITGVEVGLRFDLYKYFFLETTGKGVYANYNNVLLPGEGRGKHKVYGLEYIASLGVQFPL